MNKVIQYEYSVREVMSAVTARTSLVARHRATQEQPDRMDELTLTEGEFLVFLPMLKDACCSLFEYTAPFCRNLDNGYTCGERMSESVIFMQEETRHFDENKIMNIKNGILEALINHIMSKWYMVTLPEESANYWTLFEDYAGKVKSAMDSEKRIIKRPNYWLH